VVEVVWMMNGVSEETMSSTSFSLFGNPTGGVGTAFSFPGVGVDFLHTFA
jgi:hypothetical protein